MSINANHPDLATLLEGSRSSSHVTAFWQAIRPGHFAAVMGLVVLAVILRAANMGATFESSDQAAMGHMIRHNYGIAWLFAYPYGPVLPILHRAFAELLTLLHLPINETATRVPTMWLSLAQVAITYPLLRRLSWPRVDSLVGTTCCAILPLLVTDAHYAWADHAAWLLAGTVALWATLAYLDDRRIWQLAIAAAALLAHCLSSFHVLALPVTLMVVWMLAWRHPSRAMAGRSDRRAAIWAIGGGYVLPCILALAVIIASWMWTGKGQLGHILSKRNVGTFGLRFQQILEYPDMWFGQFGVVFGLIAAAGTVAGLVCLYQGKRIGLIAIWAWTAILPFVLLVNWNATGYANYYMCETVYTAGLLGAWWLCTLFRSLPRWRSAWAILALCAFVQLTLGSVDVVIAGSGLQRYTGIFTGWGNVRPDSGVKAAGWYVREHVPMEATVLAIHTNKGMEISVAQYYTGRRVLAHYDIPRDLVAPLFKDTYTDADVVIVDVQYQSLVEAADTFELVCRLSHKGRPVRFVYARSKWALPWVDEDVGIINTRYDACYQPRRVPLPLVAPDGFLDKLERYQTAKRRLKANWLACQQQR